MLLGMVIVVKPDPLKAASPIDVTLVGIATPVSDVLSLNAFAPMAVTGLPPILLGIATLPPAPVYPVIEIEVPLSVYVKSPDDKPHTNDSETRNNEIRNKYLIFG
jgi:hypothetical protein